MKEGFSRHEDFSLYLETDSNKSKDLLVNDFFILFKKVKQAIKEVINPNLFSLMERFTRNYDFSVSLFEKFKNMLSSIVESEFLLKKD